jgi:hypothetical protein
MRQLLIAAVALLLLTAAAPAQDSFGLIPDELYNHGFVLKRVEVTAVLEKDNATVKAKKDFVPPTPPAKFVPVKSQQTVAPIVDADIKAVSERKLPDLPPPLPQLNVTIPKEETPAEDIKQTQPPLPAPLPPIAPPLPVEDGPSIDIFRKAPMMAGMKQLKLKSGKSIQVRKDLKWFEFPNGDVRGSKPGNIVIFSKRQNEYFEVKSGRRYWDTDDGIRSTGKDEKLVFGNVSGKYYTIPKDATFRESLATVGTPSVAYYYRPAVLPRNRVVAVPSMTYSNQIETQISCGPTYAQDYTTYAEPSYSPMPAAQCGRGGCCPGGACSW